MTNGLPAGAATLRLDLRRPDARLSAVLTIVPASDFPELAADCAAYLHAEELAYFQGLVFERRRQSYLLGRFAAKTALASLAGGVPRCNFAVTAGVFGQPVTRALEGLCVSISHADAMACAIAYPEGHPMGVDVEEASAERVSIMAQELTPDELRLGCGLAPESVRRATLWTAKEALSKILRVGMMTPMELLAAETLEPSRLSLPGWGGGGLAGTYVNFAQYRFQSFSGAGAALTLGLPRRTEIVFEHAT